MLQNQKKQKTSFIWNFFSEKRGSDSLALCDICKQVLSYKSSSNNLRKHMIRKHPLVNINPVENEEKKTVTIASKGTFFG